jgi:hypothetical protein
MKKLMTWLLLLCLILTLFIFVTPLRLRSEDVHAPQGGKWKEYSFSNDGFAISSPSKPPMGVSKFANGLETHTYYVLVADGCGILVVYSPLSPDNMKSPEQILSDGRDGVAKRHNGKIVSETSKSLGGYPGLEYEVLEEKEHYHWLSYVANRKLYELLSYAPPEHAFLPETGRVFESFRFIPGGK